MIIRIKNIRAEAIVGVYGRERLKKQPLIINLEIEFDGEIVQGDRIETAIDYEAIAKKVWGAVVHGHFYLVETCVQKILDIVMEDGRIVRAAVEVDKPEALYMADSVSVSAERERK